MTRDFKGTLDYILYTSDSLAPAALLELPDESEVHPYPVPYVSEDTPDALCRAGAYPPS